MQNITDYLQETHQITLDPQQQSAVYTDQKQVLLLAVPGSGKTTVLVSRIAHLMLKKKVDPAKILTLTFSRESVKDMKQRYLTLFGEQLPQAPQFSTIHSFCYSVLRYYATRFQRPLPEMIGEKRVPLLRSIYQQINEEYLADDILEVLVNDISLVTNLMLDQHDLKEFDVTVEHFYDIYEAYQSQKKANHWMDYDDMLSYALDILTKVPQVLEHVFLKFDYLNIDEAQDTSKIQYEIVKLLSQHLSLFVVGDEDQSIYTFRGAYPDGLTQFPRTYPTAQILKVESNYRSNSDIVAKANQFIQRNKNRYPKQMQANNNRKHSIERKKLDDYSKQYDAVLKEIQKSSGTVAVLYRNNESAIPLIDLLYRNQIPFYIKEHNLRFFSSFAVRDMQAFLRLCLNPSDIGAFEQIYYKWHCSKVVFLETKQTIFRYDSVIDAVLEGKEAPFYIKKKLRQYQSVLKKISKKRPQQAIDLVLSQLGYGDYLDKKYGSLASLKLNILKTLAKPYSTIDIFLEALEQLQQTIAKREGVEEQSRITLSSIHSSKGLEFDTVLLVDLMEGILPSEDAIVDADYEDETAMEGEARLFYVAVTRARQRLVFFTSQFCNNEYVVTSRFVNQFLGVKTKKKEIAAPSQVDWLAGKMVRHKFFGVGIVQNTGPKDQIEILFDRMGTKQLSYDTCMKKQILVVLEMK